MAGMDFPSSPVNGQTTTDGRYYFDSSVGSTGAWRSTPLPVGGLPAGSIMAWGTNTPPANWLLADGTAVSRSTYSSLFAVIGTTYGTGDGTTTFNLPDLRGRVPVGKNGGTFGTLAGTGGAETHTLTIAQIPTHNHQAAIWNPGYTSGIYNSVRMSAVDNVYTNGAVTGASADVGGGGAHNNLQPYLVVNYIIKASAGWTAGDSELATRVGALETADATTNKSGLVPVVPTSVSVGAGSASISSAGVVNITSAHTITVNGVFTSAYRNYLLVVNYVSCTSTPSIFLKVTSNGTPSANTYISSIMRLSSTNGFLNASSSGNNGVYITEADVNQNSGSCRATVNIFDPQTTALTTFSGQGQGNYLGQGYNTIVGTGVNDTISRDGLQLSHGTAVATGTIQVYGLR